MRFTGPCHNWCMAAMGTLVTFLLNSAVVFYVVIIADSLHWILVTMHRYTASRVKSSMQLYTLFLIRFFLVLPFDLHVRNAHVLRFSDYSSVSSSHIFQLR